MKATLVLWVIVVATCLAGAPAQSGATVDTLKITHGTLMAAVKSGNPAMLEPILHSNALGFFRDSQMIVQFGSGYSPKDAIPAVLTDLARFTPANYDTVYRVASDTGVVCMATALQPQAGQRTQARYIRSTWIYADVGGTWKLLSWHTSDIPLAKK